MKVEDFDYRLPESLIAQRPPEVRGESRLMVLSDKTEHRSFADLPEYMDEGDVLVLNDTKVMPARLRGTRETGGKVELLLIRPQGENWECLGKGRMKEGERIAVGDSSARVIGKTGGRVLVRFDAPDFEDFLQRHGEAPTPPYIKEELRDSDRYQTVYARANGSVAAPTAGLHITPTLLEELKNKGVETASITLHVGPGTFLPVRSENVEDHEMEEEYYEISQRAAGTISAAKERGGRLFVVGTTTVRALESGLQGDRSSGWTSLFIHPSYQFRVEMDALVTNFHLPRSTVLMLVSAYAGRERILDAYAEAIERRYRFYSFGDAMLVFR
jgi:S-adenosylmethionine:tRNA ribosyltransferase-isomerase